MLMLVSLNTRIDYVFIIQWKTCYSEYHEIMKIKYARYIMVGCPKNHKELGPAKSPRFMV